jgi:mannose-6-phosphate isomerase-like protein (cupin superfamily)
MAEQPFDLSRFPVHLGLGATVEHLPEFDGSPDWYERYGTAHASDGAEGRLVSLHTFAASWDSWEMHPNGEELVACVSGRITLHQEIDGEARTAVLGAGQAIVNPPGTWHTADVDGTATALFVTAGMGTEIRSR